MLSFSRLTGGPVNAEPGHRVSPSASSARCAHADAEMNTHLLLYDKIYEPTSARGMSLSAQMWEGQIGMARSAV